MPKWQNGGGQLPRHRCDATPHWQSPRIAAKRPLQCRAIFPNRSSCLGNESPYSFHSQSHCSGRRGQCHEFSSLSFPTHVVRSARLYGAALCVATCVEKHDRESREIPWSTTIFGLACAKCGTLVTPCFVRQRSCSGDRPVCAIQGSCGWQREKSTAKKQSTFMHSSHSCGSSQLNTRFYQDIDFSFLSLLVFGLFETKLLSLFPV